MGEYTLVYRGFSKVLTLVWQLETIKNIYCEIHMDEIITSLETRLKKKRNEKLDTNLGQEKVSNQLSQWPWVVQEKRKRDGGGKERLAELSVWTCDSENLKGDTCNHIIQFLFSHVFNEDLKVITFAFEFFEATPRSLIWLLTAQKKKSRRICTPF